ncbi:MAG: hypothetical protein ACON4E_02180 [Flavobacteriales bacterium]
MNNSKKIIKLLGEKSVVKQEVFRICKQQFDCLKSVSSNFAAELQNQITDNHVKIEFSEKGDYEAHLKFSGDTLIFHMHSNTFTFDKSHNIWNSSYIKENPYRAYCGVINVYNFLSDSIKYNRENDLGFLIARIFVNKDTHFFTEGNGKMSFLYNSIENSKLNKETFEHILQELMLYAIDFELQTPPLQEVQVVSVHQIQELSKKMKLKTSKKLGYKFSNEK